MTTPTASAVTLTRPSALKEAGRTLLDGLFQPLGKLGIAGAFGTTAGVGGAAVDLVARFRPDESTEEAAWRLVWLALRDAVDDLADAARFSTTAKDSIDTEHLLQLGGNDIDLDRIEVPWTFLKRPRDLPVLQPIAVNLEAALLYLGTEAPAARAAAQRLPERFGAFFYSRAMQQRERLDQLRALLDSEPARALRQSLNWLAYGAHLTSDLEAPLFAGPFSLRQLYQPLRGYWTERLEGEHGRHQERHHVVDLAEAFDAWVEPFDKTDALRVVAGGPGSGKSSFVKWWAAQVMQRETMLPTLLVPLHYLKTLDLEREVGDYAKLHGFAANPLDTEAGERRLLLILDGLDELDADQRRGRDAAASLVAAIHQLLLKNNHNFEIQVVLAGRALIVESLQGELNRERQIFHVLGYAPREADEEWEDSAERLQHDQRKEWWRCWGALSGEDLVGMPTEIEGNQNIADLTDQPLLNHLLAITWTADPTALDASSSVNSVYARLLRHVWERSWGERQIADLKPLKPDQFTRLFESIGLAVWQHGGGRGTTLAKVAEVAQLEKLDEVLPVLKEGAEKGALALLTAFFFRRAGSDEMFELTHKTFGEYLAARRLARLIGDLHRVMLQGDIDEGEGLRRWYRLTHAARVTREILAFLGGELAELALDEVRARRCTLIQLFNENLRVGMPHEGVDGTGKAKNYREAQEFTAAAELALFAAINRLTVTIIERLTQIDVDDPAKLIRWQPKWENLRSGWRTGLWDLLRRIQHGARDEALVLSCLNGIGFDNQAARTRLVGARLQFASARNADFCRANLEGADFSGADLEGAKCKGTNFDNPSRDLIYPNIPGYASFPGFVFTNTKFIGAKLKGVVMESGIFCEPNFSGADLAMANLSYATLFDGIFKDADLTGTDFQHADLRSANFSGANLSGAKFGRADLSRANFKGAKGVTRGQLKAAKNVDWDNVPLDVPDA